MNTRRRLAPVVTTSAVAVSGVFVAWVFAALAAGPSDATPQAASGTISITGIIGDTITLQIDAASPGGAGSPRDNASCKNATALSGSASDTIEFGSMTFSCSPCGTNGDCYTTGSTARYVATVSAVLTYLGGPTCGLEVYRATPVGGIDWASGKVRFSLGNATNWLTSPPASIAEGSPTPGNATNIVPGTTTVFPTDPPVIHQFGIDVDSTDGIGSRSSVIIYRTF